MSGEPASVWKQSTEASPTGRGPSKLTSLKYPVDRRLHSDGADSRTVVTLWEELSGQRDERSWRRLKNCMQLRSAWPAAHAPAFPLDLGTEKAGDMRKICLISPRRLSFLQEHRSIHYLQDWSFGNVKGKQQSGAFSGQLCGVRLRGFFIHTFHFLFRDHNGDRLPSSFFSIRWPTFFMRLRRHYSFRCEQR